MKRYLRNVVLYPALLGFLLALLLARPIGTKPGGDVARNYVSTIESR